MSTFTCVVCSSEVERAEIETHIAEQHSDPTKHTRRVADEDVDITDADYVRQTLDRPTARGATAAATEMPARTEFDEIGVKIEDLARVTISTETGGSCTSAEAKRALKAVAALVDFRIDTASFIVNFVDWGLRNSFSEELEDAGGFEVEQDNVSGQQHIFKTVAEMHRAINRAFVEQGVGRVFTFRRFGRFLARQIPVLMELNKGLKRFYSEGTVASNRLGVPAKDCLAVCSIFEFIKPYRDWTDSEHRSWMAMNRAITKTSNASRRTALPQDLRPKPSQAETLVATGRDDFSRRNIDPDDAVDDHLRDRYGAGYDVFRQQQAVGRRPGDRAGLGA